MTFCLNDAIWFDFEFLRIISMKSGGVFVAYVRGGSRTNEKMQRVLFTIHFIFSTELLVFHFRYLNRFHCTTVSFSTMVMICPNASGD